MTDPAHATAPADDGAARPPTAADLRVLIVSDHVSAASGGEAILPLQYFLRLRERGYPTWMVVHERVRDELLSICPEAADSIVFVRDTRLHRVLYALGRPLPARLTHATVGWALRLLSQRSETREARRLVREHAIDVVHQPIPVSPKEPSMLRRMGAPVVLGPMNGGMALPPAFRRLEPLPSRILVSIARAAANWANLIVRGKLSADVLLVANERSRRALPPRVRGRVVELVENGVDLDLWQERPPAAGATLHCTFVGRLIDIKAVDVAIDALAQVAPTHDVTLEIIGDGPERARLEERAGASGVGDRITFSGWMRQEEVAERLGRSDAFVMTSLMDCGGAVVLEAMAVGLPVIATDWGGPADYVDATCGILVAPTSRQALVDGIAGALRTLAGDAELRARLGRAGRQRIVADYDWETKVDAMLRIYRDAIAHRPEERPVTRPGAILRAW